MDIPSRSNWPADDPRILAGLIAGLGGLLALLAIRYQVYLLDFRELGDESETIVAARMMASGMSLYSEIFNHHGPLTFLPGFVLESFGRFGVQAHRVPIAMLQWAALAAIFFSPMATSFAARVTYTGVALTIMVAHFPGMFGHAYTYQTIAGLLVVVVLAQYTLPAIACPERLGPWRIATGNFLLGSIPFLSFPYLPLALLLFAASCRREYFARAAAFMVAGIGANVVFLALAGSVAGYLAFHLYLNSVILPMYTGVGHPWELLKLIYLGLTRNLESFLAFAVVVSALTSLAARQERGLPWRPLLLGLALASLLIRGAWSNHQLTYFYACLALPLSFSAMARAPSWQPGLFLLALQMVCAAKLSLLSSTERQSLVANRIPAATEFSRLAQAVTGPDDRIIVYFFYNYDYLAADRLPASGHFFYLPWQAKYNENPRFGIEIDACEQIRAAMPKIMQVSQGAVWDTYPWASYGQCVQAIVDEHYYPVQGRPFYLRKDISPGAIGVAAPGERFTLADSRLLSTGSPIPVFSTQAHRDDPTPLKAIGIHMRTHGKPHQGETRLDLVGVDQERVSHSFPLEGITQDGYRFFALTPGRYASGSLSALSGGGVGVLESRAEDGTARTCLIYDYVDGRRRFTPGCPT